MIYQVLRKAYLDLPKLSLAEKILKEKMTIPNRTYDEIVGNLWDPDGTRRLGREFSKIAVRALDARHSPTRSPGSHESPQAAYAGLYKLQPCLSCL